MNLQQILRSPSANPSMGCSAISSCSVLRIGLLALLMGFLSGMVFAQGTAPQPLLVRSLNVAPLTTPSYTVNTDSKRGTLRRKNTKWLEVRTEFRVEKPWIDEATFKYYVLFQQADPRQLPAGATKNNVLSGSVSYEDIPAGKGHLSTMFLSPSKVARYGKPIAWRVEVTSGGKPVGFQTYPPAAPKNWHQQGTAKAVLLNRHQTPFSPIDYNSFNDIKIDRGR